MVSVSPVAVQHDPCASFSRCCFEKPTHANDEREPHQRTDHVFVSGFPAAARLPGLLWDRRDSDDPSCWPGLPTVQNQLGPRSGKQ